MSNQVGISSYSTPDVQRVALEEKNKAAVSILLKNVTSALAKKSTGDSSEYNKLLALFNQTPSSMLGVWFTALSQVCFCCKTLQFFIIFENFDKH